ncbi:MAG: filamentous hemagglutinin N-terminal domain-containing protein [Phycisphaerae bacterium]|nr:filamentous hemagglutinin N-terminal domain-containing protein [Phycisphaerae bacterium]
MKTQQNTGTNRLSVEGLVERCEAIREGGLNAVGRMGGWSSALSGLLIAAFTTGALAGPEGSSVVRGDVNISRSGAETIIRAGRNSIINHRSFDIARGETVRFIQPDAASRVLNRITGASPTRIDGSLIANGRVYLVNPAGVYFSGTARVDVARLYAAGANLSDRDFVRGLDRFTDARGAVINEGTLTANFIGLLGKTVTNGGTINAPRGTVVMAAGEDILIGERTGNVFVKVSGVASESAGGAAVTNTGTINAQRGRVSMAAGDVYSMAIRAGGKVKAAKARIEGQGSGEVRVDGSIDAGGATGGDVRVLGEKVSLEGASIDARGDTRGGHVLVGGEFQGKGTERRAVETTIDANSIIRADATAKGDAGTVVVWSDNQTNFAGTITATGPAGGGDGGNVEVSGKENLEYGGIVRIGAVKGRGGSLLLDPQNITVDAAGAASAAQVAAFNTNANTDRTVSNATLDAVGGNVTLQANNDITVNQAINLTTGGATLTMQAGRSILLNQSITTNNGAITLIANDVTDGSANTVQAANRSNGTALITFASGVTINAGSANIQITMNTGSTRVGAAATSGNITLGNLTTTGHALVRNIGPTAGSGIVRQSGTSLVAASSVAFDVSGAGGGGGVGASGSPIRTAATNVEALGGTGGVFLDNPGGGTTYGGATLGGLTGVSATTTGEVSIAAGGAATISENIASGTGDITITTTGLLTNNAAVSTDFGAGSDISVTSAGAGGSGTFAGNSLTLAGTGTFALGNANNVVTFAAATNGAITFNDTNGFSLGGSGVSSTNNAISLSTTAGGMDIAQPLNAGSATLTLNVAAGVSGNAGAITAGTLTFGGGTAYTLTNPANNVTDLGGTTTGAISFTDADGLTITGLASTNTNITINASGLLTITGLVDAGTGDVSLTAAGVTQSGAGAITSDDLLLAGTGTFNLGGANNVATFAAGTTGAVIFSDTNGFSLSGGIATGNSAVSLIASSGTLTIDQTVNAGTSTVTLTANDLDISAAVTGNGGIAIAPFTAATTVGVGAGAGTLSIDTTELGLLTSTGIVTIGSASAGNLTTSALNLSAAAFGLALQSGAAIDVGGVTMAANRPFSTNSTGGTTISGAVAASGTGSVTLTSGGAVTQTAQITTPTLTLAGAGAFTLTDLANNAGTLSGSGAGAKSYRDTDALTVSALSTTNNAITLNTGGLLTITGSVAAGTGTVSITAAGVTESGGTVSGGLLSLAGAGTFAMGANNDVSSIEAAVTGVLTFNDANGFTVAGTGITTGGNAATLSTTVGGIAINQPINVGASDLTLNIAGAATQGGSGAITASGLRLLGGGYTLTNTGNAINTLAANTGSALLVTDADGFTVGTVGGTSGITTTNNAVTLTAVANGLAINQPVGIGSATLTLNTPGTVTQGGGGGITAATLDLRGTAVYTLDNNANDVDTLTAGAGSVGGNVIFHDTDDFILGAMTVSGGTLTLRAGGGTVTQSGVLNVTNLLLTGPAAYTLTQANTIATLAADNTGAVTFRDTDGFAVGTVGAVNGMTTLSGAAVDLTSSTGTLTITDQVNAGNGTVTLTTDAIAVGNTVTGGAITIRNATAGTTIGLGSGAGTLNLDNTELGFLSAANGTVTIGRTTGGLQPGALTADTVLLGAANYHLHLIGASIAADGITLTGRDLTLQALTGGATSGGAIIASGLRLLGTGTFTLTDAGNNVGTLAANTTGAVEYRDADDLAAGTVAGTVGITTGGQNLRLTSAGGTGLDITQAVNAGAGEVFLTADTMNIAAAVTGNGNITIVPFTAATNISIADPGQVGDLNLSATEMSNLASTACVLIGDASSGTITTGTLDLSGESFDLFLRGTTGSIGALTTAATKALTLQFAGAVSQTGLIDADQLRLIDGGFNLSTHNNVLGTISINTLGNADIFSTSPLTLGNVVDSCGSSGPNQAGMLNLKAADLTIGTAVSVASAVLSADAIAVNAAVTSLGDITVRNCTAGVTIGVGNGAAGALSLTNAEVANLVLSTPGSTLTFGRGDAGFESGALTTAALNLAASDINLTLVGDQLALGGTTLGNTRTLTLNALTSGATQSGALIAGTLDLQGAGFFDIPNLANDFTGIRGAFSGDLNFSDANTIATIGPGVNSGGNDVTIRAPLGLTITATSPLDAGAGIVTLAADALAVDDLVTGNGGIFIIPFNDGTTIGVGGAAGSLNIDATELTRLVCNTLVTIGRADAGPLTTDPIDVSAQGYSLALGGATITTGGITVAASRSVALSADETNGASAGISVNGPIIAPGGFDSTTDGGRNIFAANITTTGTNINITGPAFVNGSAVFDATGGGAAVAGADITFSDILSGTTADTDLVTLNAGTGGDVAVTGIIGGTRFNTFTLTNALSASFPELHAAGGGISLTAASITLSGGADTTGGGDISLNGAVNATGGSGLDAGSGSILFGATSSLAINGLSYALTAEEIDLPTAASSVTGGGGSALTLQSSGTGTPIRIGGAADSGAGTLDLTDADLAALAANLGSVTIGRADGTHAISIESSAFRSMTTVRAPLGAGAITVDGTITGENAASDLTLAGANPTTLNANIVTAGADITIQTPVILGAALPGNLATLDTTNAGAVPAGANVGITGTTSAATDGVQGLSIASGTGGVVSLGGTVGPGGARVGSFAITSAASANLPAINAAAGGISLTGGVFTLSNGVNTTAGGTFLVNNSGLLTLDTTALSLDGAFTQNAGATGGVSLGTNITTTDDSITFVRPLGLTNGVQLNTGAGGGDVAFGATIDGAFPLDITAGTGAVNFGGRVGNPTAIGALTVFSAGSITVAGGTAPTINAATVSLTTSGLLTINGTPADRGGISSAGPLNITAGSMIQSGNLGGSTVLVSASGAILVDADVSAGVGGVIVLHSGTSGTGDLNFGSSGPLLTADDITLRAGDGAGGAGTTAIVDALTNPVDFAGATLGAPSPMTVTIRADGDLTTDDHLPDGVRFNDITGMNYTIKSDDGSVTIAEASKVNASNLTLMGATGVNINVAITPQSLIIMGDTVISGDIITDGDLCFGNAVTLAAPVTVSSGSGLLEIKGAFNSSTFNLTLRGAEINITPTGTLAGTGNLTVEPHAAGANVVLGAASEDASAGLDFSNDELGRIADGYASRTFGRADGTGQLSFASPVTLPDPTTFRMNGAGGSITLANALTGTGNAQFGFLAPATTFTAGITTAGGAVAITGPLQLGGVTIATGGGTFSVGGATTLIGNATVNTSNGAVTFTGPVNADLAANNRALTINAGTGNALFSAATGGTGRLGALTITAANTTLVSVITSGAQTYTGNLRTAGDLASEVGGDITITGDLALTTDAVIRTAGGAGDDIAITGLTDTAAAIAEKSLVLNAGTGSVALGGDAGGAVGLSSFAATGGTISTRSVRTPTGGQTFTGPTTVTGSIASGGDVLFSDTSNITGNVNGAALAFTGNSTVGGNVTGTGNVLFSGTSNITGNVNGAALTFTGNSTIGGSATGTGNVLFSGTSNITGNVNGAALTFTGDSTLGGAVNGTGDILFSALSTIAGNITGGGALTFGGGTLLGGNVTSTGAQSYNAGATFGTGAGGAVAVNGASIIVAGPVILDRSAVFTAAGDVTFGGTILSAPGDAGGNALTINSPGITTFGGSVGGVAGQELASIETDAAGTNRLNAALFATLGDQTFRGNTTLGADASIASSGGGVTFQGTIDSFDATARDLTVNSGGGIGNTTFGGSIGGTNPLDTLTTNANGTTFLPTIVRTNGQQTYLDDVRLIGDTTLTVLTSGGVTLGARVDSDSSTPRALTVNSAGAGETRFGGAVGSQNVLSSLSTNADGAVFIGGDISTNGAQSFGESAATITGDAVLSGNGITFPGIIVSDGTPHDLTLTGGAGGVSVGGDIGVGNNLGSLTASGTTVGLRGVQTIGDQTYTGTLTVTGSTIGSAFTSNGPATITGNVSGTIITFAQPVTLAGSVTSFENGGSVTFANTLALAADSVVAAGNGTILFSSTVNSSDATARALTVNNTGATTFTGAVGTTNRLSTLTTDAGGSTRFNGGSVALTGIGRFNDAVILGANTTFTTGGLVFTSSSTLDSDGTPRTVRVEGDVANKTTEFLGVVGGVSPLGRLHIHDTIPTASNRTTKIGANMTLTTGMVVNEPVEIVGDVIINAGNDPVNSTLFFRSTIDADSELNNRSLTLLSGAIPAVSANPTSTDISPVGSTRNVTPFRFAGSIGAANGKRLGSLTIGGDLAGAPPLAPTAVFAPFNANGAIPFNNNFFSPNAAQTFFINVGTGGFTMGRLNKLTTFGNLSVNVRPGGTARLGDLVATSNLSIVGDQIILRTRQAGQLFDDEFIPNEANPKLDNDSGLDLVAGGTLAISGNTGPANITRENTSRAAFFANSSGDIAVPQGPGLIFAQFQGGVTISLFNHNLNTGLIPLDLKTQASDSNVATSLAGAIPRDRREREVTEAVLLSSSFGKPLANLGINIKELSDKALSQFLIGRSLYQDVPLLLNPTGSDFRVTINRLSSQPVLSVIRAYCNLFYADGNAAYENILNPSAGPAQQDRAADISSAMQESWDIYTESTENPTGQGFRAYLESRGDQATEADTIALDTLNQTRSLLSGVEEIGLSPREEEVVRRTIIRKIGGRDIPELEAAVLGSLVASR